MQNPDEFKKQVRDLVANDQRYQAIRLIQNAYQVDEQQAHDLLAAIEREDQHSQSQQVNAAGGCLSGVLRVVSILMAISGILFLTGLGIVYYYFQETKNTWVSGAGMVVSRTPFELDQDMYTLEVRYAYLDSTYTFTTASGFEENRFAPGDSIPIWINPTVPPDAIVQDEAGESEIYYFLGIAGGVLLAVALLLWQLARVFRPKNA
jgi:hypothetical protein